MVISCLLRLIYQGGGYLLFSIIVPMYNVEQYAKQCIESVLHQTFTDYELIIVNDGSTDHTASIVNEYVGADKRVRVIHKENGGLVSARKAGSRVAGGEYVVALDGDDWLEPGYLSDLAAAAEDGNPDVVISGYTESDGTFYERHNASGFEKKKYDNRDDVLQFINEKIFRLMPIVWGKAFKRETYCEIQEEVPECVTMGEDSCVTYPIIMGASCMTIIDSTGYCYRVNPNSMTRSKTKQIPWESTVAKLRFLDEHIYHTPQIDKEFASLVVHALFTSLSTNIRNRPYGIVRDEANKILEDGFIARYFREGYQTATRAEKIAYVLMRFRLYPIIKLIALLR